MKNIFVYYISLLAPLCLLLYFWTQLVPTVALVLLVSYALIYRTWLDGTRLYQKNKISKQDIWKISYNGNRIIHFRTLYLP